MFSRLPFLAMRCLPGALDLGRCRHRLAALGEDADAAPALFAHAHPARLAGPGIDEHHVGGVDHALLLDDAAGAGGLAPRLHVALVHPHLLHSHPAAPDVDRRDPALLALVGPGDHLDEVALADA